MRRLHDPVAVGYPIDQDLEELLAIRQQLEASSDLDDRIKLRERQRELRMRWGTLSDRAGSTQQRVSTVARAISFKSRALEWTGPGRQAGHCQLLRRPCYLVSPSLFPIRGLMTQR